MLNIIEQVLVKYPEDLVISLYDEEVLSWVDEDWDEEFDNEHDWYTDFGRGEAEAEIIKNIIADVFGIVDADTYCEISDALCEEFLILETAF